MNLSRRAFVAGMALLSLQRQSIRIGSALGPAAASAARGMQMGVEEARRGATLLGFRLETYEVRRSPSGTDGPMVVADGAAAAVRFPRDAVLHVLPPARVRQAALARWLDEHPGTARDAVRVAAWHRTLERYGAEQLNARFERQFNAPMDGDAWSGWMAVKIVVETALRSKRSPLDLRFDGHKGAPLVFDKAARYLRQPLYVVQGAGDSERVVGEVA